MAFDTFDTDSVATAGVTFTNGNLTAQGASGAGILTSSVAQAIEGKKSGKWYVEFTCVAVSGNVDGVCLVASWGTQGYVGNSSANAPSSDCGWGFFTNGNVAHINVAQTAVNNTSWGAGDVICLAIDLDNSRAWWRKNGGNWIGTSGTPNPATNTSGFNISNLLSNSCRVYPAANLSGSAAKFTANFGATSFAQAVPSGFTSGWTNTTAGTYFGTFATNGRSGTGNGVNAPPQNNKAVSKYTSTITGNLDSIIIPFAGGTVIDMKAVIYDDTGTGGLPGALLGVSTNTIGGAGVYGENTFTFSGVSLTSGSAYWMGMVSDTNPGITLNILLCCALTNGIQYNNGTYATPTNPFGASPSSANFRYPLIMMVTASTTYNDTVSETTTAADTVSATTTLTDAVTETATATDTAASRATFGSAVAETATALDTTTNTGSFHHTVTEAASAADTVAVSGGGVINVALAEAATALDTVATSSVVILARVLEEIAAEDTVMDVSPFVNVLSESAAAVDTVSVTQHRRREWFLSFEDVVPPPESEGPGNTGKLFGDFHLVQIYP